VAAELIARAGPKVVGEHRHPGIVERFTVLEGELMVKRGGKTSILPQGQSATIESDEWQCLNSTRATVARPHRARPLLRGKRAGNCAQSATE